MLIAWMDNATGQQRMVEDLSKKITARCEATVWSRIQPLVAAMDPAQSLGYIRARAASVIARETAIEIDTLEDASSTLSERVIEATSDAIVRLMVAQIARQHPSTMRRAA